MAYAVEKNGKWNGRFRDSAGRVKSAGTFPTKVAAQNAASAAEAAARLISAPTTSQMEKLTVDELVALWWPTRTVSASTLKRDEGRLRLHLLPHWGHLRVREVTRAGVQDWVARLTTEAGLGSSSIHSLVSLMSGLMVNAMDRGIVQANPVARMKLPKGQVAEERFLSPEEVRAIADAMNHPQARRMVLGLAYTGCRPNELIALHWSRVDREGGLITVAEAWEDGDQVVKAWPKTKAPRRLPIPDALLAVLGEDPQEGTCGHPHFRGFCSSSLVFPSPEGHLWDMSNFRKRMARACWVAGVEHATPYDLRHTYASWLAQRGQTLDQIARVLGHGNTSTTRRYVHYSPGHLDQVREALNLAG